MSGPDGASPAEVLTPEAERFLEGFRARYSAEEVIDRLGALSQLRVLVIGDAIVDEYHFVQPYGMPTKAPVIAARFLDAETYAGGCFAVANHVAGFCREVHLVTCLGADDPREEFARKHLLPNVTATFFTQPGRPTTIKRRYLRRFLYQKLFEVSFFDDRPIDGDVERQLLAHLLSVIHGYDLVLAADFGHGLITRTVLEMLCAQSRFLAVNTQLNSINFGYHLITRYHRADYVCIDEEESRMACRDRLAPLDDIVRRLSVELRCGLITAKALAWRASSSETPSPGDAVTMSMPLAVRLWYSFRQTGRAMPRMEKTKASNASGGPKLKARVRTRLPRLSSTERLGKITAASAPRPRRSTSRTSAGSSSSSQPG
jgi:hypothetical protein